MFDVTVAMAICVNRSGHSQTILKHRSKWAAPPLSFSSSMKLASMRQGAARWEMMRNGVCLVNYFWQIMIGNEARNHVNADIFGTDEAIKL